MEQTIRVNKQNKSIIENFIVERFNTITKQKKRNFISILDIWDTEMVVEKKFNISDPESQKITMKVINKINPKWEFKITTKEEN